MPFDHNDHYHPLLLRQLPAEATTALDVGCGTGKFARRMSRAGLTVDAVDNAADVLAVARSLGSPGPGAITYRQADVRSAPLPAAHYDVVSCLASLHHMPFETVTALRQALRPGGVLLVLGLAKPGSIADRARWLGAVPVNLLARAVVGAAERLNGGADATPAPPIREEPMSMARIRTEAAALLPGSRVRVLAFWRYLLTYRAT